MKNSNRFSRTRFVSQLRIAGAVILLATGCAIAIVGTRSEKKEAFNPFRGDPDRVSDESQARPGPAEGGPWAAAAEKYALRAYPASDIPFELTKRATESWNAFQAESTRAMATNATSAFLNWSLFGPSVANFPNVLTFTG